MGRRIGILIVLACWLVASGCDDLSLRDKLEEQVKLWYPQKDFTGGSQNFFGFSVDMSDEYIVVGAHKENSNRGAAYVYKRNGNQWEQLKKLVSSDIEVDDWFGYSVAISGSYIVVGAPVKNIYQGAAYIFHRDEGGSENWGEIKVLTDFYGDMSHLFGSAVDISGDSIIVGSYGANAYVGKACIFNRNYKSDNSWALQEELFASDGSADDKFGFQVAIANDLAAVSAPDMTVDSKERQGKVYLFERSGDDWGVDNPNVENRSVIASIGLVNDAFGYSIDLDENHLIVGTENNGSVFVYNVAGGESKEIIITNEDALPGDRFGNAVAISGWNILIGAYFSGLNDSRIGKGYFYYIDQNDEISLVNEVLGDDLLPDDRFGYSVSISSSLAVICACNEEDTMFEHTGKAFTYSKY